jgi:hypothetical protein
MIKKKKNNGDIAKRMVILPIIIFSGWLFFWPLVECWYAQSLSVLIDDSFKLASFIIGGIIFWAADYYIIRENKLV